MFRRILKPINSLCVKVHRGVGNNNMYSTVIKEQKILVDGVNVNFVRAGDGDKAVLCLPGALGSAWTDFKPQIEKLPSLLKNTTLVAWDPPGYGLSRPPDKKFDLDFLETDAELSRKLMAALGFDKFSVLGWSDGGITGLFLSANHPDAVDKLVIWGANSHILPEEIKIYEGIRDIQKWSPRMREPLEKMYGAEYFRKTWEAWVDVLVSIYKHRNGDICNKHLQRIKCSTFIVHGAKDPMISNEHIPYLLKHIAGSKSYTFPDGKHNIHLRYPDEFNKLVMDFIQEKNKL